MATLLPPGTLIGATTSVNEAVQRFPTTRAVFGDFGIDPSRGRAASVARAAVSYDVDGGLLLHALNRAAEADASAWDGLTTA